MTYLQRGAKRHGATVFQIATSWTLAQNGMTSAIIGTQNQKHFLENIKAFEMKLTGDELREIGEVSSQVISAMTL